MSVTPYQYTPEQQAKIDAANRRASKSRQRVVVQKITAEQLVDQFAATAQAMLDALNGKGDIDVAAHALRDPLSVAKARQRRRESFATSGSQSAASGRRSGSA